MAKELEQWLRNVAEGTSTQEHDQRIWHGLIRFNNGIIKAYVDRVDRDVKTRPQDFHAAFLSNGAAKPPGHHGTACNTQKHCKEAMESHGLRRSFGGRNHHRHPLNFLGTYLATFLTFKTYATKVSSLSNVKIICLSAPELKSGISAEEMEAEREHMARKHELNESLKLKLDQQARKARESRESNASKFVLTTRQHAELQLTDHIEREHPNLNDVFRYIGYSKLSCHMCYQVLKMNGYATQECHGIVFPGWDIGTEFEEPTDPCHATYRIISHLLKDIKSEFPKDKAHRRSSENNYQARPYISRRNTLMPIAETGNGSDTQGNGQLPTPGNSDDDESDAETPLDSSEEDEGADPEVERTAQNPCAA